MEIRKQRNREASFWEGPSVEINQEEENACSEGMPCMSCGAGSQGCQ